MSENLWRSALPGDRIIAVAAALVALLYSVVALAEPTALAIAQAAISWCFVPFLLVWRSQPVFSGIGVAACLVVWSALWVSVLPANPGITPWVVAAPMVVYSTARYCTQRITPVIFLAFGLAGSFVSPVMWQLQETLELRYANGTEAVFRLAFHWALIIAVYFAGTRGYSMALHRKAAERQRLSALRSAQEEERLLIARELHDALAHTLTLTKVQATAGIVASKSDPAAAVDALAEIRRTSDEALTAVRDIVHALRRSGGEDNRAKTDIAGILDGFRAAGLTVSDQISPELAHAPELAQLAVRRIITESLTNVLRHQGVGARAHVEVSGAENIEVECISEGSPQPGAEGSRVGLVGLAERARSLGGTFESGGTARHFRTHAVLPARGHQ